MGEQGTVMVSVLILADGHPEKAEIRTSSGYPRLDEAAIAGVQGWRFVPGKRNGVAQAMWFNIPIRFVLD
jgi:protein TonB